LRASPFLPQGTAVARHGVWHIDLSGSWRRPVGVSPAYISRIAHGERVPTLQLLERVAEALGVELAWLRGTTTAAARRSRTPAAAPAAIEVELKAIETALERIRSYLHPTHD